MKEDYTKLYDSYFILGKPMAQGKSGEWHNARPEKYRSLWCDIRNAWNVLTGRADALYWTIDED